MERLTPEDRLLGRTQPLPKTELELKAFTSETKYIVYAEGSDNKKEVDGLFVARILPFDIKQQISNGKLEVKANGLVIKRLEQVVEETSTTNEETSKPKRKRVK